MCLPRLGRPPPPDAPVRASRQPCTRRPCPRHRGARSGKASFGSAASERRDAWSASGPFPRSSRRPSRLSVASGPDPFTALPVPSGDASGVSRTCPSAQRPAYANAIAARGVAAARLQAGPVSRVQVFCWTRGMCPRQLGMGLCPRRLEGALPAASRLTALPPHAVAPADLTSPAGPLSAFVSALRASPRLVIACRASHALS
jgi:hypothetical protein